MARYAPVSKAMQRKLRYIEQGDEYYLRENSTVQALMSRGLIYIDGDSEANPDEGPLLRLTAIGHQELEKDKWQEKS